MHDILQPIRDSQQDLHQRVNVKQVHLRTLPSINA